MAGKVSTELRRLTAERAHFCCEYCLLPQDFATHRHEPDHIVPVQHGGASESDNLAFACFSCNRYKGPNVGSYDPLTGEFTPFFNPRTKQWRYHFRFVGATIEGVTPEGRVTAKILQFNDDDRVAERRLLIQARLYPST
jgi:hypothetical protein